jgi:hypothetical protein
VERRIDLSNIDLDRVAEEISERRAGWMAAGLTVGPITWMDNEVAWPRPVATDRSEVKRPMSVGVRIERGATAEAELIVYAGGWADLMLYGVSDEDVVGEYLEIDAGHEVGALVDRAVARLMSEA